MIEEVRHVAVIGSGVIGASWSVNFAIKGYTVFLHDIAPSSLESAKKYICTCLDHLIEHGALREYRVEAALSRIHLTESLEEAVGNAFFIQENIPDKVEIKQEMLGRIEALCPADAIYASSTSHLLITDIAAKAQRPERCIGGHPFNPPHLIPLVEVSRGKATAEEYLDKAVAFYRSCGKAPVVLQKESIGFIANRLSMALFREAVDMVRRGVCTVADVDAAVTYGPGMRWAAIGPHLCYQLGGSGGFKGLLTALSTGGDALLSDLANWKSMPQEYLDVGQAGVLEEMTSLPEVIGHTEDEIIEFRDKVLIKLLMEHDKI